MTIIILRGCKMRGWLFFTPEKNAEVSIHVGRVEENRKQLQRHVWKSFAILRYLWQHLPRNRIYPFHKQHK